MAPPKNRLPFCVGSLLPLAGLVLSLSAATTLEAQLASQRSIPTTYAITNAKIVPVGGAIIAKGTIVIRNGLIAAVGASVAVPGDARVIDASGLTVYPGFIDGYGSLGLTAAEQLKPDADVFTGAQGVGQETFGVVPAVQGSAVGDVRGWFIAL